ncbi:MAG: sigma 54-interacting transcriptional regulator, partial [Halanaerobiales bacterium]|nr:sigma 54-interacting transcriptional regulator [Halanaerobiales bacterium]
LNKIEQEKTQRYRTILDYSYEGIIALDQCNHITVCNSEAKKTLDILKKDVIGKKIHNLIDDEKLKNMMINENAFYDEVMPYHDIKIMMKKVPIMVKGEKVGSVINLQDITGIQDMEGKIRKKIYTRGHIAKHTFDDLIAKSDAMIETIEVLKKFSQVDSDVLIIGDSGTGKEICAQSIHNCSDRRKGPFVAVNCAAIPGNLLESELFGYVGGAFTGASKEGKPGFFELAHNGTIFLDEIAEMPINLQVRLLRVLQEREVIRIGDDKVMPINVRVIAATNKDLYQYVEENKFREDLYYRLDVLTIYIPSLSERGNDVILIAEHYIKKFGEKHHHN